MKISDKERERISDISKQCGGAYNFSKLIGVSHTTIYRWVNGTIDSIDDDKYEQICSLSMSDIKTKSYSKTKKSKDKPKTTTNSKFVMEAIELYMKDKDLSPEYIKEYFSLDGNVEAYITDSTCKLIKTDFEKLYPIIREYYNFPKNQEKRDKVINRSRDLSPKESKYRDAKDILKILPEDLLEHILAILKALPVKK